MLAEEGMESVCRRILSGQPDPFNRRRCVRLQIGACERVEAHNSLYFAETGSRGDAATIIDNDRAAQSAILVYSTSPQCRPWSFDILRFFLRHLSGMNKQRSSLNGCSRRKFLANASSGVLLCGGLGLSGMPVSGVLRQQEKSPSDLITESAQRSIDRGLGWLARRQVRVGPATGSFGSNNYARGVAVTSLAGLAFMCGGSSPGEGPYGAEVDRAVGFVLSNVRETGYIALADNSVHENMYGHGFAMLFLAQAYGMTQKEDTGAKLRRAVDLTVSCQNNQGGWRYTPTKSDADLSITVCQIMALRAARDCGIHVPDETRRKCIEYVHKSQSENGSFRYTLSGGGGSFAMTAAGVTSLYSAGIYDAPEVSKALDFLMQYKPNGSSNDGHYFYAHYYAVQAMWHAGGKYWAEWYPAIRDELVSRQASDGSWHCPMAGQELGTAMACIVLQIPLNYLPIFSP